VRLTCLAVRSRPRSTPESWLPRTILSGGVTIRCSGRPAEPKDPTDLKDLELILGQFDKDPFPRSPQTLWNTIIDAVPRGKEKAFLLALPMVPNIDYIDAGNAFTSVREKWSQRAVVRQEWPSFLKAIGGRFAVRFSNHYRFYGWLEMNAIDNEALKSLKAGLLEVYSDSSESMDAEAFFRVRALRG
jgi:hypothetical protein